MNFLAHYVLALRLRPAGISMPLFVAGNALPDLLPPGIPRLRPRLLGDVPSQTLEDSALWHGVGLHLATDAAFHKTPSFSQMQAEAGDLLRNAGFVGVRVRVFFVAHVLVELALDAALLRADSGLANRFYDNFCAADVAVIARWTEGVLHQPLPALAVVLARFGAHQYLRQYSTIAGVAEGLTRVCARARQDTFDGDNLARLTAVVGTMVERVTGQISELLEETSEGMEARGYWANWSRPEG